MADTYNAQLDKFIIERYRREVKNEEIDLREVAAWALRMKLWEPPFKNQIDQLHRELSAAARAQTFKDSKGRKIRSNYCVRRTAEKPDGTTYIQAVWSHIDVATHPFMEEAFRQIHQGLSRMACRAAINLTHYNEYRRGDNEEIQMHLDFRDDAADFVHSTEYQPEEFDSLVSDAAAEEMEEELAAV